MQESDAAGGPTLLPEGQRQAHDVGVAFRERYLSPAGCGRCVLPAVRVLLRWFQNVMACALPCAK